MLRPHIFEEERAITRLRKAIRGIYDFTSDLWTERNTVLHDGETAHEMAEIFSTEVAEIKSYHQQRYLLRFDDRHLCDRPLKQLLTGSAATRRRWLRLVKRSRDVQARDGQTQQKITSFFTSTTS